MPAYIRRHRRRAIPSVPPPYIAVVPSLRGEVSTKLGDSGLPTMDGSCIDSLKLPGRLFFLPSGVCFLLPAVRRGILVPHAPSKKMPGIPPERTRGGDDGVTE